MTAQSCPRQHCATTMDSAALEPSLYTVKAVFILDNDGNRLLSKYYDPELYPSMKEQKNFEKNVFNKTHKADNEIAFLEGMTIVYKSSIDLFFYVVGSAQENELMLMAVLNCLFESLSQMLRKNVEKRTLLDNMDGVFLVVDEIIDGGQMTAHYQNRVWHSLALTTNSNLDSTSLKNWLSPLMCYSQQRSRSSGQF
ncbi:coatomer subunit zeta-1-like isoform X2 [Sinocyclocheilus rhinocerous]|uniref:coatomer subunit zeta-1-like isoform X2 n=1 Tax=Sinocyclocheilus rhinocerous TaxID=307959 RepID=UPI0007B7A60C|nr:PREDICTED: coatomer subunit zeta-1-like isoform X2 [Sinocyclocheilus rhinocerous]